MKIWLFVFSLLPLLLSLPDGGNGRLHDRIITFAGWQWRVKDGCGLGPGPNCFSDSNESVWLDGNGWLHLKIRSIDSVWNAAEVISLACTRHAIHRFYLIGAIDQLDPNVVAAPFLYKDDLTEIDIEFAKWGNANAPDHAQYVVQPYYLPGHLRRYVLNLSGTYTTHAIDWQSSAVHFQSLHGHFVTPPSPGYLIDDWSYTGSGIPQQSQCLHIHINLWLFQGQPPTNSQPVELIVAAADLPQPCPTAVAPQLTIQQQNATTTLGWNSSPGNDGGVYIWRSSSPYFSPGDSGSQNIGQETGLTYPSSGSLIGTNFYRLQGVNSCDQPSVPSNAVGIFDYALVPGA